MAAVAKNTHFYSLSRKIASALHNNIVHSQINFGPLKYGIKVFQITWIFSVYICLRRYAGHSSQNIDVASLDLWEVTS